MREYKNKVGIFTFHESLNFGALLQAYALQKAIEKLDCDVTIIDYHSRKKAYAYTWKYSANKTWKQNIISLLSIGFYSKRIKYTENYSNRFLAVSKTEYTEDNLEEIEQADTKFVCGSDQVWNLYNTKEDWTYFLPFVEKRESRIAYGASTGVTEVENKYRERFIAEVRKFGSVSVRGKQEAAMIKEYCSMEPQIVLDPTLLLRVSDWNKVESAWKQSKKYIFLYTLGWGRKALESVKKIALQEKLPVVVPVFDIKSYFISIKYGFQGVVLSPQDYLAAVRHAECVFTDAYHGIIFSIVYHKPFWVLPKKEQHDTGSRIDDFLEMTGLMERKLSGIDGFNSQKAINYQEIDRILDKEKKHSISYLQKSLCNSGEETIK